MLPRHVTIAISIIILAPALHAQHVERVELATPVATFHEPFSRVVGMRELANGTLLIADRLEQAIRLVDLAAATMEDVGRVGGGPGEFQMPGGLLPLPGDSSLLLDYGNMRLSVMGPNGRIAHSTSMMTPEGAFLSPRGVDAAGYLYLDRGGVVVGPNGEVQTERTVPILRRAWEADAADTVAFVPLPEVSQSARSVSTSGGGVQVRGLEPMPMAAAWAVAPDGRVAVVYPDPYRVEWFDPRGASSLGPVVTYEPVRVTDEDKEAWADRMGGGGAVMIAVDGGGGRGGRSLRIPRPDPDEMEWPEFKPPFPRNAARTTPEGELWVLRHVATAQPQLFDVFDKLGTRVRQVELPLGRQLVGFGEGVVYVVNVDEEDLQWLEAYERD